MGGWLAVRPENTEKRRWPASAMNNQTWPIESNQNRRDYHQPSAIIIIIIIK